LGETVLLFVGGLAFFLRWWCFGWVRGLGGVEDRRDKSNCNDKDEIQGSFAALRMTV
jgi:hypothetical protein